MSQTKPSSPSITLYIAESPTFQEHCSSMAVYSEREAEIMLWALAKQAVPEWAMFTRAGSSEPTSNAGYRSLEVPADLAAEVSDEVARQNKLTMETFVVEGLNSVYDQIAKHFGDQPGFVELVSKAAESWARDCY